jgi:protein-disulfide isomerase
MNQTPIKSTNTEINQSSLINGNNEETFLQLQRWKLIALLFIGLFVGSLLVNFIPPFSVPYSVLKNGNLLSFAGNSWIRIDEVIFNGYILTDTTCKTCDPQKVADILRAGLAPTIQIKIVDLKDNLGKKLSADFKVSSLPMIFFDKSVEKTKRFSQLEQFLIKKDEYYNLDISLLGLAPDIFYEKPTVDPSHPTLGSVQAPLVIYEFIDYQCPFCKKFADETLPKIINNYVAKNKVRIVFKDFPLDFHQNAMITSWAVRCANNQGKFKQMHDILFAQQQNWSNLGSDKIQNYLTDIAAKLSLNQNSFKSCLKDENVKAAILADLKEGKENFKVNGTPSFLINQRQISGALPYGEFEKIIESELGNK